MNKLTISNLTPTARRRLLELAKAADLNRTVTLLPKLTAVERTGEALALSFAQQRLWFLAQMDGVSEAYHIPGAVRLRGRLDRGALGRALSRIVERHEALRTCFRQIDGQPVQVIKGPGIGLALQEHDLRGEADGEERLRRLGEEEAGAAFDLEEGPLIRARLVRLGEEDHVLLVTMHHIVSDGWSMGVLINEVSALYGAYAQGREDPLPALPIQYADYAAWQRRWLQGEGLQRQVDYWKHTLAGAPALLELPSDRVRPQWQDYSGATVGVALDAELTRGLKALSQRHGVTLYMTLLAGWAALLGRLSGQEEVVIGSPVAGRNQAELEPLVGFFVNTLALRLELSEQPTVEALLRHTKERVLAAQQHQDLPFEHVVEIMQPSRSLAYAPLFQVMFAWQNTPTGTLVLPGLELESVGGAGPTTAKFDLTLSLQEAGDMIVGGLSAASRNGP